MNPPAPSAPRPDPVRGIMYKVMASAGMALVQAIVKAVSHGYPIGEIVFFRCFFMLVPVLAFAALAPSGFAILKTQRINAHFRRAAAGSLGIVPTFGTLMLLPLADATALSFSAPLVLVALAAPLLGERIGPYRIGAVVIGFIGVLLVVQPHASAAGDHPYALFGVGLGIFSAFGIALAQLSVRALRDEPALTTVFYFTLFMSAGTLLTLPFGWHWPRTANDGALLISTGIIGGFMQIAFTNSYRYADASLLAPFDYLQLIWAVAIGYFIFGEMPLPIVLLGAFIVAASGVFIALREHTLLRRGEKIKEHSALPEI